MINLSSSSFNYQSELWIKFLLCCDWTMILVQEICMIVMPGALVTSAHNSNFFLWKLKNVRPCNSKEDDIKKNLNKTFYFKFIGNYCFLLFMNMYTFLFVLLEQIFLGNNDQDTISTMDLIPPILSQYIRINPCNWTNNIALRMEFSGCSLTREIRCKYNMCVCLKQSVNIIYCWLG